MRKDFWASATVRTIGSTRGWMLWSCRIQAPSLSAARLHAIDMLTAWDREYGQLDILWDAAPAQVVTEADLERYALKVGA